VSETQRQADVVIDTDWIKAHLGDPEVRLVELDVSSKAYDQGHLPGAVLWNVYSDLRDATYMPVGRAELERLLSRSGITPETTIVVYGYSAPLGFWLMTAYRHKDIRILGGTRDVWAAAGGEWSTEVPHPAQSIYSLPDANAAVLASRQDVESAIGEPRLVVLDVRSSAEYSGERFWPSGATEDTGRSGHVPGAVNVPIDLLRREDTSLKEADELRVVLEEAGVGKDKTVITYCTIANRASQAWFALKYVLGYPDVRVYYASWVEWGKLPDTPIES
jgi:thiosulfate/3-mercaptopyruvate sulfurtransferase